jgi:PAS domain S-box-containing protein
MNPERTDRAPSGRLATQPAVPAGFLEPIYGGVARLAAGICGLPYASISLTDCGEAWYRANDALPAAAVPQSDAFFEHASRTEGLFEVEDTARDERLRDAAWAAGASALRFCAGCALRNGRGEVLGVLAVYGTSAHRLSPEQRASLLLLAEQGVAHAEFRARLAEIELLTPAQPDESRLARALIDSAPVAIYHTGETNDVAYVNPEYRRVFNLGPEQSVDDWALAVHPDDRARMQESWADFCRRPRPVRFEYRTLPADGGVRYFSEQVVAADGVAGFVGTISDFTDLVTARGNLRRTETLFHNTFDQAPIGIAYADRSGKYLRCNPAFCALLGFDAADISSKSIRELTHGEDVSSTVTALERLWNGEVDFVDLEKRYTRKDGSLIWIRMTTSLIRDESATPEFSVEFLRDITARKESAQELERVHKELMAASRQAGMAEVATNVLHNVGNILNSVNISASLVAERVKQSKAPGVSRIATLLQEKGPRLAEFIAKDERGKRIPEYLATLGEQLVTDQQMALQELASLRENLEHIKDTVAMQQNYAKLCGVTETVQVIDLVEDSLRLNAGAFVRHGVTLRREFAEVPPITVDKHKVLQILVNLVRNAKYACDESGRTDKLLTLRIEGAEHRVRISVIDNGIGIPAENMSRIFTHGFTTRQSGHGFGLHSGALAAQDLGGSLRAESAGPGCGAAFILELPCGPPEQAHA